MKANNNVILSAEELGKKISDFISHVKEITTEKDGARQFLPEFRLQGAIREKIADSVRLLSSGNIKEAQVMLEDASRHFQNQQAAFARGLKNDLQLEIDNMVQQKVGHDLISRVHKATTVYENLMCQRFFEPTDASKTYWATIDVIEGVWKEHATREENKKNGNNGRVRRALREEAQNKEQKRLEKCAQIASPLLELVGTL